jgi:hypothetical protein
MNVNPGRKEAQDSAAPTSYKVYVMLGFHASFYHSWRGDTPDEAGFGTDIRVVRQILQILNRADERGLQVRGYWDFDIYWTLQEIIPRYAPDIIAGIRQRVEAGRDEIVAGPYNNGANHAATERELRAAIAYAFENPFGSGLNQLFGRTSSAFRPQESMYSVGQNAIYLEEGVSGLVLYYAGVPFNALSTFIPALPPEQRYNAFWLRSQPDEPPIVAWPCISPADLVEHVSLEALMLDLRQLQISGKVRSDLLIHLNFDADAETWLPVGIPKAFAWFPNTGGLEEYMRVVNRYPWAAFTVPSEYLQGHEPQGEVLVRQDLADGAFDGSYSWAEKYTSLTNWTLLERSRLHTYRAEALVQRLPAPLAEDVHRRLWQGMESSFFQRLVGLSCTHFGMSTPVINEERQAKAEALLGAAQRQAAQAERDAALALRSGTQDPVPAASHDNTKKETLYVVEVFRPRCPWQDGTRTARAAVRLPVILPPEVAHVAVQDAGGKQVVASLVNAQRLSDGSLSGELLWLEEFGPAGSRVYRVVPASGGGVPGPSLDRLQNRWLDLRLSEETGIASLAFEERQVGSQRFLEPFITYRSRSRPESWFAPGYTVADLSGETWNELARARIQTSIQMETPRGPASSELQYTFTLFDRLPYLLVDVEVEYASTPATDAIQTIQQKLRRLLDLRWIEVAPMQLTPEITASLGRDLGEGPAGRPLRVWKHNYLGLTSYYDLDYGRINVRNKDLDSFNHQVTAGWVAVSNGQLGVLLAENAEVLASMAFCPMRLREREGVQQLSLNPFGSYHGRQLDYSHLGGTRLGAEFTVAASGSLRPNGPSFNGRRLAFSLLLAPYVGDEPPSPLQADALAHFYPAGVTYLQTPAGLEAAVPDDVRRIVAAEARERQRRQLRGSALSTPAALLANSSDGAVSLVWEPTRDARLTGYEVRWRQVGATDWRSRTVPSVNRWQVSDLRNGQRYQFQVCALARRRRSDWTGAEEATPGEVGVASLFSAAPGISPWTLLRMVGHSLAQVIRARTRRHV